MFFGLVLIFLGTACLIIARNDRRAKEAADAQFNSVMLALEEKAKREGTFRVSYFDKQNS